MSVVIFQLLVSGLVLVRFFIETVRVLPESFTFAYDAVLIVALLVLLAPSVRKRQPLRTYGLIPWIGLFTFAWLLSSLLNRDVHLLSSLAFLLMNLEGILWFLVLGNLDWTNEQISKAFRFIMGLGVLELVLTGIQIPYALHVGNPDLVVGTFGQNNSQFAFFLTLFACLLIAAYTNRYLKAGWILLLLPWATIVFYAIGFRAMFLSFPLTCLIVLMLQKKLPRKLLVSVAALLLTVSAAAVIVVGQELSAFGNIFSIDITDIGKIRSALNIDEMYKETPHTAAIGCGPATFSSRAWSTFTRIGAYGAVDYSVFANANWGMGLSSKYAFYKPGRYADKYTMDIYKKPYALLGSITIDGPFSSYLSVLAEVGLLGALGLFGAYVHIGRQLWRVARDQKSPDALPKVLAGAAIGGFLMIAQMSVFDNWLEVGRVTVMIWSVAALVMVQISRTTRADDSSAQAA